MKQLEINETVNTYIMSYKNIYIYIYIKDYDQMNSNLDILEEQILQMNRKMENINIIVFENMNILKDSVEKMKRQLSGQEDPLQPIVTYK